MNNTAFVAAAFTVTWLTLIGYLVHLRREVNRAHEALDHATRDGGR